MCVNFKLKNIDTWCLKWALQYERDTVHSCVLHWKLMYMSEMLLLLLKYKGSYGFKITASFS